MKCECSHLNLSTIELVKNNPSTSLGFDFDDLTRESNQPLKVSHKHVYFDEIPSRTAEIELMSTK